MSRYSRQDLREARRAIASTLSKSEKALVKLKEGTVQHTMTARGVKAYLIALALIDREAGAGPGSACSQAELDAALEAIAWAKSRVEEILPKFAPGSSQHTLALRRIAAFGMAAELIRQERREEYLAGVTVGERTPLMGAIPLSEYDAGWPALFRREAERLSAALGDGALQIEHVGSTSVPGLCAKPIIDMLLVVDDSADESSYLPQMEAAGYTLRIREPDWFQHRMFKGPDTDVNLHVFSSGASEIRRMLAFRDRLRENEADRDLYARTKRQLASQTWRHVQNYADAKTAVVEEIMGRALSTGGPR